VAQQTDKGTISEPPAPILKTKLPSSAVEGATEAGLFAQEVAKVVFGDVLDEDGMKVEARIRELAVETTYLHLDLYNHCRLGSSRRNKPPFNNPIRRPSDSPFVNKGMV